jgi:glycosyltransferase involved in cell wall biosynthesis
LPVILHVGRLDLEKKVDLVVRAAARAMQSVPAQLLIVGHGTERPALERLVADLGIGDRVRFAGSVPPEGDLPGLYRLASVFGVACEIETEGIVVLEASASGVPIVAVRATAMPELLGFAGNGFLVPPGDDGAMAEKFAYLLSQPDRGRRIGLRGIRLAAHRSLRRTVQAHLHLYRTLVTTSAVPQPAPTRHRRPLEISGIHRPTAEGRGASPPRRNTSDNV